MSRPAITCFLSLAFAVLPRGPVCAQITRVALKVPTGMPGAPVIPQTAVGAAPSPLSAAPSIAAPTAPLAAPHLSIAAKAVPAAPVKGSPLALIQSRDASVGVEEKAGALNAVFENPAAPTAVPGPYELLSAVEVAQLGQFKKLQHGKVSDTKHIDRKDWPRLRALLVERSLKANPRLDVGLTAYTPGETLNLMKAPAIAAWHDKMRSFRIPARHKIVILVPCAKTKPWVLPFAKKSKLYKAYNEIRELARAGKIPPVYFATVSEPLGVVPEEFWSDFPQYDNPGLFKDDSRRSGLLTKDWAKTPFGSKKIVPFDERAYDQAVDGLSGVIAAFMKNNRHPDRRFLSFVEDPDGGGTHSAMLDQADRKLKALGLQGVDGDLRFLKRPSARASPKDHILEKIRAIAR